MMRLPRNRVYRKLQPERTEWSSYTMKRFGRRWCSGVHSSCKNRPNRTDRRMPSISALVGYLELDAGVQTSRGCGMQTLRAAVTR